MGIIPDVLHSVGDFFFFFMSLVNIILNLIDGQIDSLMDIIDISNESLGNFYLKEFTVGIMKSRVNMEHS